MRTELVDQFLFLKVLAIKKWQMVRKFPFWATKIVQLFVTSYLLVSQEPEIDPLVVLFSLRMNSLPILTS